MYHTLRCEHTSRDGKTRDAVEHRALARPHITSYPGRPRDECSGADPPAGSHRQPYRLPMAIAAPSDFVRPAGRACSRRKKKICLGKPPVALCRSRTASATRLPVPSRLDAWARLAAWKTHPGGRMRAPGVRPSRAVETLRSLPCSAGSGR